MNLPLAFKLPVRLNIEIIWNLSVRNRESFDE